MAPQCAGEPTCGARRRLHRQNSSHPSAAVGDIPVLFAPMVGQCAGEPPEWARHSLRRVRNPLPSAVAIPIPADSDTTTPQYAGEATLWVKRSCLRSTGDSPQCSPLGTIARLVTDDIRRQGCLGQPRMPPEVTKTTLGSTQRRFSQLIRAASSSPNRTSSCTIVSSSGDGTGVPHHPALPTATVPRPLPTRGSQYHHRVYTRRNTC